MLLPSYQYRVHSNAVMHTVYGTLLLCNVFLQNTPTSICLLYACLGICTMLWC